MRAAASFHSANALGRQSVMFRQKLAVFLGENVIGHGGNTHGFAEPPTKLQHQRGLATAHRAAHANRESPHVKVAVERAFAVVKMSGMISMLVYMSFAAMGM